MIDQLTVCGVFAYVSGKKKALCYGCWKWRRAMPFVSLLVPNRRVLSVLCKRLLSKPSLASKGTLTVSPFFTAIIKRGIANRTKFTTWSATLEIIYDVVDLFSTRTAFHATSLHVQQVFWDVHKTGTAAFTCINTTQQFLSLHPIVRHAKASMWCIPSMLCRKLDPCHRN